MQIKILGKSLNFVHMPNYATYIEKFDRTDPDMNKKCSMSHLRSRGRARARDYIRSVKSDFRFTLPEGNSYRLTRDNPYYKMRSTAFEELQLVYCEAFRGPVWPKNATLIDMGCGDSPDAVIAKKMGIKNVYAVDLWEPSKTVFGPLVTDYQRLIDHKENGVKFIKGDYCEELPIKSGSVDMIISSAALDLTHPFDRILFYEECWRLLKKGGGLSIYFVKLRNGHGFDLNEERTRCEAVGFKLYRNYTQGFIMHKR